MGETQRVSPGETVAWGSSESTQRLGTVKNGWGRYKEVYQWRSVEVALANLV